ncbi:MAG: hypothetical protein B7Y00_01245, partial [Sphingomonadales bacterium 17-56-6]
MNGIQAKGDDAKPWQISRWEYESMGRVFTPNDPLVAKASKNFAAHVLYRHDATTAIKDMFHSWVLALRNSIEPRGDAWDMREAEYMDIVKRYGREGVEVFAECLGLITMASNAEPGDHVGTLYHALAANNKWRGQFFTPYSVSSMMAQMAFDREVIEKAIAEKGYVSVQEPSCGAGGMVIAIGEAIRNLGFDPAAILRVHAIDIDRGCVDM